MRLRGLSKKTAWNPNVPGPTVLAPHMGHMREARGRYKVGDARPVLSDHHGPGGVMDGGSFPGFVVWVSRLLEATGCPTVNYKSSHLKSRPTQNINTSSIDSSKAWGVGPGSE